jgi:hypothetical protein
MAARISLVRINGYQVFNDQAQFLLTTPGIEHGEVRGINSFTDRYVPIDSIGPNNTLIMAQPAWQNNIIEYDTIIFPFADNGFFTMYWPSLMKPTNIISTPQRVHYTTSHRRA